MAITQVISVPLSGTLNSKLASEHCDFSKCDLDTTVVFIDKF